jgi:ATP/maltotriose-dependent transcriptional regulator MalT/DNA-binding SARP family transcriptional activator
VTVRFPRAKLSPGPPLLRAKLSLPVPGEHVLSRPRLLAALNDHAQRPLTLVVADAGYGKTTLLGAWVRGLRRPVVWYSLMPSDADPVVFGRYLLEGFRRHAPRFGRDFERALEEARSGPAAAEMLGGTLANEMVGLKGPPHLLVLDDFHEAAPHPIVAGMMDTLLRHLPRTVRLVVASRTPPPLALERLRARGELFELDSGHLRLTREELRRLFEEVHHHPLDAVDLEALEQVTLGWPTAVHLAHESLRRSDQASLEEVLAQFHGSHLELHDYLSAEVYARLDEDCRRLLERTAALARFDVSLAAALTGTRSPRPLLDTLARRGLLRAFSGGAEPSYECLDLVRRFVRQQVEARGLETWRSLEGDTAAALVERGEPERALHHFLLAGRALEAARLLRQLARPMLDQGRAAVLLGHLTDLPVEIVREDPELSLLLADAHQVLGHWDQAETLYAETLERCRARGARREECLALLGQGKVFNLRGRHEHVLGMAERGLAMASDLDADVRARLLQMKAAAHYYLGQFGAAIRVLDQVRTGLGPGAPAALRVQTVHNLAIAYAGQGRFREAAAQFRQALAEAGGPSSPRAPLYLSNLAFALAHLGELAEARNAAEEGLAAAKRFSHRARETTCHEALAQILAQAGDLDGALAELRQAEVLNAELRMEVIASDLLALRGRIFCARGQYRRAVEFLTQAIERLAERPAAPELAEFHATLAWCELRAGRVRVARDLLVPLADRADAGENDYQRMRARYWLGEARLALGEARAAETHLAAALRLVRERGYFFFLRGQAREEPAPLLHALEHGLEADTAAAALVEAGTVVEEPLLGLVERGGPGPAEAALAVLAEIGTASSQARLAALGKRRRALAAPVRTALRHIAARAARRAPATADADQRAARLLLFGPPRLLLGGEPVPASAWRAQRAFHLLVFLVTHPRGATKEQLLEHFWPGRQLAAGRRNFHPTLSYVRSVLPANGALPLEREGETYRLNAAYPMSCDLWDLDEALAQARAANDRRARRAALEGAAALATGSFLEGFYGDWAESLQARMRERVEKLLTELGDLCAAERDDEAALEHLKRAVELDEFRETTRLMLIECLMRLGRRRDALVEYERMKTLLRDELQVDPLPETEEAMRRLLAGEGIHGWPPRRPAASAESDAPQPVAAPGQVPLKNRAGGSRR